MRYALVITVLVTVAACSTAADDTTTSTTATTSTTSSTTTTPDDDGTTTSTTEQSTTTTTTSGSTDLQLGRQALLTMAQQTGATVPAAEIPFAATVSLGLHDRLLLERSPEQLADYDAWIIDQTEYAGFGGPFNPIAALRNGGTLAIDEGPHPHCANPPLDPPAGLEDAALVSAQPKQVDSCIDWFSVDLWIVDGEVVAVTLALFGP